MEFLNSWNQQREANPLMSRIIGPLITLKLSLISYGKIADRIPYKVWISHFSPWIHTIFTHLRACGNRFQNPLKCTTERFLRTICFLCKCTWWPRSHPNPRTHLCCSLTLFFWWIRSKKSKGSLRITEKEFHMCECVYTHTGYSFQRSNLAQIKWTVWQHAFKRLNPKDETGKAFELLLGIRQFMCSTLVHFFF